MEQPSPVQPGFRRRNFLLWFLILMVVNFGLFLLLGKAMHKHSDVLVLLILLTELILFVVFFCFAIIPRALDIGFSPWSTVLIFVPLLGTVFFMGLLGAPTGWYTRRKAEGF